MVLGEVVRHFGKRAIATAKDKAVRGTQERAKMAVPVKVQAHEGLALFFAALGAGDGLANALDVPQALFSLPKTIPVATAEIASVVILGIVLPLVTLAVGSRRK